MSKWVWVLVQAIVLAAANTARAAPQTITICGDSSGTGYFFEGGIVGPGQGGWQKDGITGGRITLTIDPDTDKIDISFKDAIGRTVSHAAQGWSVRLLHAQKDGSILIIAEHSEGTAFEHYHFRLNDYGVGTVAWGTVRAGGLANKSSLFTASCSKRG